MPGLHLLDRAIGDEWPSLATDADLRAFESVPYEERIAAPSTYEALRLGAARDPKTPALLFLPNASPDDEPLRLTHGDFFARVTQIGERAACAGRRAARRGQHDAAAGSAGVLCAVRRAGGRHRQPGQRRSWRPATSRTSCAPRGPRC